VPNDKKPKVKKRDPNELERALDSLAVSWIRRNPKRAEEIIRREREKDQGLKA
jgi:hypothetical protein